MAQRERGKCKWFQATKGFGFIARADGKGDVFVHHSAIEAEGYRSLNEGDNVEFEVVESDRGPKAEKVKVI